MEKSDQKKEMSDYKRGYLRVPTALMGVFIFMTAQTFAAVWWAATMSTKLDFMQKNQSELKKIVEDNSKTRYSVSQATVDLGIIDKRILAIEYDLKDLNKRVVEFQSQYKIVLDKIKR